jgi:hypothetical protein
LTDAQGAVINELKIEEFPHTILKVPFKGIINILIP